MKRAKQGIVDYGLPVVIAAVLVLVIWLATSGGMAANCGRPLC